METLLTGYYYGQAISGTEDRRLRKVLEDLRVETMNALICSPNDHEYRLLEKILEDEADVVNIHRARPPDPDGLYDRDYDLIIVACEDETGLRHIREWKEQDDRIQIIWIIEDYKYMKDAFGHSVFDCFQRPYDDGRVRHAIRHVLPKCQRRYQWQFGP